MTAISGHFHTLLFFAMKIEGRKNKMEAKFDGDNMFGVTPVILDSETDSSAFKTGDLVKVSAISKGKGFQGVVKRHGFSGGPKTHGQKNRHRAPGSIGSTAPQRTLPGRKMAGRMGGVRVSVKNLRIAGVDSEKKIIFLNGAVPGNEGGKVEIYKL